MTGEKEWKRARLIPVAGIKGDREAEQRATSALLAVLSIVRGLSHELLTPLGASSAGKATVECYTEVILDSNGTPVRPDGLIRVSYGARSFTALVEVKTGRNKLDADQVNAYWHAARQAGFNHVITISNEIGPSGAHPTSGLKVQKNSPVQVTHLSWVLILSAALRLKNHTGVDDPEQAWILDELVRYLQHDAAGVLEPADMGENWSEVRDAARAGTLQRRSEGVLEIARRIDEMHAFSALKLSTDLGWNVDVVHSKLTKDPGARLDSFVKAMCDGLPVVGRFRIPNTAGDIITEIDLRAQQLVASIEIKAPEDRGARGRVGWLLAQLGRADGGVVVEAYPKNARVPLAVTLQVARDDRNALLGTDKAEASRFVVRRRVPMPTGRKSTAQKPGFMEGFLTLVAEFYGGIVQDLKAWQPSAPRRRVDEDEDEPEVQSKEWSWSPSLDPSRQLGPGQAE